MSAGALGDSKEIVDQAKTAFVVGVTKPEQVEEFFKIHALQYTYVTREADSKRSPNFQWSSETASGYYVTVVPRVRTKWTLLSYENVKIYIEIDRETVSKVVFEKSYTGL